MEITAEMNKVFGQEMAKLFAATISEEELTTKANIAWDMLNQRDYSWGSRRDTEIERLVREQILARIHEKVKTILEEPIADEILEKRAREMVEEARKAGEEAIIQDIAHNLVKNTLSIYGRDEELIHRVLSRINVQRAGL